MASLNQLSTLEFQNNLVLNLLDKPDKSKTVYDFSGGYNLIDFLATRNTAARQINGLKGIFSKPLLGNNAVVAQVATNTLVGTNMRVTFTDPAYNAFRVQVVVSDGTAANNQGRIISKGPGFIVIEPVNVTFAVASHFVAGTFATALFTASGNIGSTGVESLYEFPTYVSNQTSITRESSQIFRRDMAGTWVQFEGDYWWSAQDTATLKRFANAQEYRGLFSDYVTTANSSVGGEVNYSMGLRNAIRDPQRGGIYQPLSSAMTQADFESWIGRMADRQALAHTNFTVVCGRGFLKMIQGFTTPFIQFSGKNNTFGGQEVKGIDVMTYSVNGITVDFIMHPIFNNREMWPAFSSVSSLGAYTRMEYTAVALDLGMIDAIGGSAQPAIEKVYFGEQEIVYAYMAGIGMGGAVSSGAPKATVGGSLTPVTDRDSISLEIYSDCAYDFMPYRMGWLELVV